MTGDIAPSAITLGYGETKAFRVKLSTSPTWPVAVYFHWEGDDALVGALKYWQARILLPSSWPKPTEGDIWQDFAYRWSEGIPVDLTEGATEGDGTNEAIIRCDVVAVPHGDFENYLGETV